MDTWEFDGRLFEVVMASDVDRDGMSLELRELGSGEDILLEAFWRDGSGDFQFIVHGLGSVPFSAVERFIAMARENLPPTEGR